MTESVIDFYDRLSLEYRDNMGWDWDSGMRREGAALHKFISRVFGRKGPFSVLDCTCGIGTQATGLALLGNRVHASDLSSVSVEQAEEQAKRLNVSMTFSVSDFTSLDTTIGDTFDVVLSCDNAIAHCLDDEILNAALTSMKTRLKPGGLLLLSLRDYAPLVAEKPRFNNEHVDDRPDGRRVVFQLWDWAEDGRSYRNNQFLLRETGGVFDVKHFQTVLRALGRDEILSAINGADYVDVIWHTPEESGYYQPIVTAGSA